MADINKYFTYSEVVEIQRSEIHPAEYNPRIISDEGRKALKRSIKKNGIVGGIVVNKQTGNTIVGGHQKVDILDELNKYNPDTKENDYLLRVEMVDIDLKAEKTLNLTLNNQNVGGSFDWDKLREVVPDIDYKDAGLTEADLSMIGLDVVFRSDEETNMANELEEMMFEVNEEHQQEVAERKAEREAIKAAEKEHLLAQQPAMTQDEKTQHMKDVKAQVREAAIEKAGNMEAYFMLSFDTWENKALFCQRFGYDPTQKFIKGEDFEKRLEGIDDDE
ncbi:MAG: DNA methylase [Prevotella sp.]|nr:DNA methylase [Candidatus Prevotella equi]